MSDYQDRVLMMAAPIVVDKRVAYLDIPATAPNVITEFKKWDDRRRSMIPRVIHAEWERRNDGPWVFQHLRVLGDLVKKDGSASQRETQFEIVCRDNYYQACPSWVSSAINGTQPDGGGQ